jgi:hypothetical protein
MLSSALFLHFLGLPLIERFGRKKAQRSIRMAAISAGPPVWVTPLI